MLDKRAKRIPESLETLTILRTLTGTVHRGRIDISSFAVTGWTGEARQSPFAVPLPYRGRNDGSSGHSDTCIY
jgi:hypothetical protein